MGGNPPMGRTKSYLHDSSFDPGAMGLLVQDKIIIFMDLVSLIILNQI